MRTLVSKRKSEFNNHVNGVKWGQVLHFNNLLTRAMLAMH